MIKITREWLAIPFAFIGFLFIGLSIKVGGKNTAEAMVEILKK